MFQLQKLSTKCLDGVCGCELAHCLLSVLCLPLEKKQVLYSYLSNQPVQETVLLLNQNRSHEQIAVLGSRMRDTLSLHFPIFPHFPLAPSLLAPLLLLCRHCISTLPIMYKLAIPLRPCKPLRSVLKAARVPAFRHFTTATPKPANYTPLFVTLGLGIASFTAYTAFTTLHSDDSTTTISVYSGVDPLPKQISSPLSTDFELIGYGIREVTFLRMKVYALGLYIAKEDIPLVKTIFNSKFIESFYEDVECNDIQSHKQHLSNALSDPKISNILIKNLITSNVRFTARICAIRNTDLSHLRDGFIRTIRNNPNYSVLMKDETTGDKITHGIDSLRDAFNSVRMSAKKNSRVYMEVDGNQHINIIVHPEGSKSPTFIGTMNEPLVTQLLFESYLGAQKPLVQAVQNTATASLVDLV